MGLYNSPISVVWDCIGINEEAKLILKHDVWVGDVSWSIVCNLVMWQLPIKSMNITIMRVGHI